VSPVKYDFNLLVSCPWGEHARPRSEILNILSEIGDETPNVEMTLARGIIGVKTTLDARSVIQALRSLSEKKPVIRRTLKWVPIDLWTNSDIDSIKEGVRRLRERIGPNEIWRMTVEKRRYTGLHTIDIIKEAAELIAQKVDLKNPNKILRIDLIGNHAGIIVLKPDEISAKMSILFGVWKLEIKI
jgi:tRNA acetyltransferase TAN1